MSILDTLINDTADYAAISTDPAADIAEYGFDIAMEIAYRDALNAGIHPDEVNAAWNTGMDLGTTR